MGKHTKTEKSKIKKLYIIILVLLVCCLVIGAIYIIKMNEKKNISGIKLDTSAHEKKAEEDEEKKLESQGVTVPGWKSITVDYTTDTATVDFKNPEKNKDLYYLSFELVLNSTGESLYKSDLVEVGKTISKINISKHLEKGTYDATVNIQPYKISDNSKTNNAAISIKLIVK